MAQPFCAAIVANNTSPSSDQRLLANFSADYAIDFHPGGADQIYNGSYANRSASPNASHNAIVNFNGGSSAIAVDGTLTTGLYTGTNGVGTNYLTFGSQNGERLLGFIGLAYEAALPQSCNNTQMKRWDANVHAYWGTGS